MDEAITALRQRKKVLCSNLKEVRKHSLEPPTSFRTNEFLAPFAEIVQTYGVATYQEANPTVFTAITFPFLFGVMFGDIAHGLVLLCLSIYICLFKDKLKATGSMLTPAIGSRYLLLLMGFFSTFCGFIYNEFASIPLNLEDTCFTQSVNVGNHTELFNRTNPNCVYSFGIDPKWGGVDNGMQFNNSFKMKFAVIIGVIHMILGVALKGMNTLFHKDMIDFTLEFLPQIIFMVLLFGYMDIMIIIKWGTDWTGKDAPSLITQLVNIGLNSGNPGPVPLYGDGSVQKGINQAVMSII